MTIPLASASSNVYTVEFDGFTISILAAKRHKLLRQIPLGQLHSLEFRPASGVTGGSLRFHVTGQPSPRDTIWFRAGQEAPMAALAASIQQHHRPPAPPHALQQPVDPWPPMDLSNRVVVAGDPRVANAAVRALTWGARLEAFTLILMLIPCLLGIAVAVWLWLA